MNGGSALTENNSQITEGMEETPDSHSSVKVSSSPSFSDSIHIVADGELVDCDTGVVISETTLLVHHQKIDILKSEISSSPPQSIDTLSDSGTCSENGYKIKPEIQTNSDVNCKKEERISFSPTSTFTDLTYGTSHHRITIKKDNHE